MKTTAKINNHTISDASFSGQIGANHASGNLQFIKDGECVNITGEFCVKNGSIQELIDFDDETYVLHIEGRNGDNLGVELKEW